MITKKNSEKNFIRVINDYLSEKIPDFSERETASLHKIYWERCRDSEIQDQINEINKNLGEFWYPEIEEGLEPIKRMMGGTQNSEPFIDVCGVKKK